ncbi:MAG: hypothetical protein ABSE86_10730 [Bryobacteraceae bacterium]|jgi:hypothetical protein
MAEKVHIAHLINPVGLPPDNQLARTQPLTFESMRRAAEQADAVARIDLLSTQYPEDHAIIPAFFTRTPDLERSVADLHPFTVRRKLPLICDLVERLYAASDAPYLIYTNADIILHPSFYQEVANRIRTGLDAFIINRRRVPGHYSTVEDLAEIYTLRGAPHPGFDCFVFHRTLYPKFQLGRVCVGIPFIEMLFAQNLFCHAQRFALFDREILTFHVGMEIFKRRDREYLSFNKTEFWRAIGILLPNLDSRKFPWGGRNFLYRMIRWGLHPAIPIRLALMLEPRRWRPTLAGLT